MTECPDDHEKKLTGTSNDVERLFSKAKLVLTDRRAGMTPYMFEILLFLTLNSDYWGVSDVAIARKNSGKDDDSHDERLASHNQRDEEDELNYGDDEKE